MSLVDQIKMTLDAGTNEVDDSREEKPEKVNKSDVRLSISSQEGVETHLVPESLTPGYLRRRTPRSSLSPCEEDTAPVTKDPDIKVSFTCDSNKSKNVKSRPFLPFFSRKKTISLEEECDEPEIDLTSPDPALPFFFGGGISRKTTPTVEEECSEPEIDLTSPALVNESGSFDRYESTETYTDGQSTCSASVLSGLTAPTKSIPHDIDVPQPSRSVSTADSGSLHQVDTTQSPGIRSKFQQPHKPPTKLHEICSEANTVDDLMQARSVLLKLNLPRKDILGFASIRDGKGRNPMHLISENNDIAEDLVKVSTQTSDDDNNSNSLFPDIVPQVNTLLEDDRCRERLLENFVLDFLLAASPGAAMSRDFDGYIPFEKTLVDWVNHYHDEMIHSRSFRSKRDSFAGAPKAVIMSAIRFSIGKASRNYNSKSRNNTFQSPELERGVPRSRGLNTDPSSSRKEKWKSREMRRNKCFPIHVQLSSQVSLALKLLSGIVERLEKLSAASRSSSKNLVPSSTKTPSSLKEADSFDRIFRESVSGACAYGDIQDVIVSNIAAIPDFVKLVLLLDDEEEKKSILSTTIMRRVLMNKHSVGTWLTAMLQSGNKRVSSEAIEYLKLVSDITAADRPSPKKSESSSTLIGMERHRDELTNEISHLKGFVPSLLALGERGVEDAATSMIVRRVMDRIISRPFSILFIVCDSVFLAILIFGFRSAVNNLLAGGNPNEIMRGIYTANTGIFYFIIRELGKAISLCMVTRSARMYLFSFWNLTDLTATFLALGSILSIRSISRNEEDELEIVDMHGMRNFLAVTTGFLWLRVLNLLKGINMQMATFILAILQITKDTFTFGIILLIMVVAFGQMFYTILVPEHCSEDISPADDPDYSCKQSEYIFRVYTILLGDFGTFERENFKTVFALLLLIFYSFMVIIVLLNVLIAVASDSYEKCLLKSQMLFGRARVMLIAELVCFQSLLRKNPEISRLHQSSLDKWWSNCARNSGWSRGSLTFFALSSFVIVIWAIGELAGSVSGERYGNVGVSLCSILINLVVFAGMMVLLRKGADTFTSKRGGLIQQDSSDSEGSCLPSCLQKCMLRVMGSSQNTPNFRERDKKANEWRGRVHFLQSRIDKMAQESHEQSLKQTHDLEQLVAATELRLKTEMVALDQRVESLSTCLLMEIRQLHETTLLQIQSTLSSRQRSLNTRSY